MDKPLTAVEITDGPKAIASQAGEAAISCAVVLENNQPKTITPSKALRFITCDISSWGSFSPCVSFKLCLILVDGAFAAEFQSRSGPKVSALSQGCWSPWTWSPGCVMVEACWSFIVVDGMRWWLRFPTKKWDYFSIGWIHPRKGFKFWNSSQGWIKEWWFIIIVRSIVARPSLRLVVG